MFVVILTYVKPTEQVDSLLAAHCEFMQLAYDAGSFLMSGPRHPRHGGVILAKAENREAVLKVLEHDPFYQNGIAEYQIIEFIPNRFADEIEHVQSKFLGL